MTTNKKECWGDRPECWSKTGVAFYCEVTDSVKRGTINIQSDCSPTQAVAFFCMHAFCLRSHHCLLYMFTFVNQLAFKC